MKDYRVDEKGKFFTNYMTTRGVRVIAATVTHLLHGTMHLRSENRVKDEMNGTERFFALTNVQVFDVQDKAKLYDASAILLNKEQIVWLLPQDEEVSGADATNVP